MVSSSSFLLLLSILFTNDATISVAATNDKDVPAFPLSSNYDDILQQESTIRKLFENDYMEDGYFETDADSNQLEVTSRRNPRPRPQCQLCPYKEEIGDPEKFFTSSYGNHFRGTCKDFYDTQEENMAKPGQGGYSRNLCGALKSDYKKHCKCVPKGTVVTKCKEQLKDTCDPNQSDDQCCIGSCQYVNRYKRNLCTTTTSWHPSPAPVPPQLLPRCEVKLTIDVANIDPIKHTRCSKRSKSFGFKYTLVETYKLTIENTGNGTLTLGSLSLAVKEVNDKGLPSLSFDYTEQHDTNMEPGERLSFEQKIMISSTAQTRYYGAEGYIAAHPFEETNFPCRGFAHRFTTYEGCDRV
eukprot:CAMPEP_0194159124 /NCGR_PEP_ID=MMETSP0152-20130528/77654_1 /TAXON_ID=1049557 /ORGANISM="Thalassiothrix antarctica, Strain L6-D1" /LENGTH=353 /DNA_ID=CAMNT_0038868651 /DNA_START=633 /DNA_END=1694 /DNA_ORIENTATION=+